MFIDYPNTSAKINELKQRKEETAGVRNVHPQCIQTGARKEPNQNCSV